MSNVKKLMMTAAGGEALNVEDVFSTYLYDGSSSAQTITNGIDLSGEGGMVWIKERSTSGSDHGVHDTERGVKNPIFTNLNDAENSYYNTNNLGITAFNSDGFTVASGSNFNDNGDTAVSWTFRKAPKFFDIVTYTGDGTTGRQISHNLDATVGMMILKETSGSGYWGVYHRSTDSTAPEDYVLLLNSTSAKIDEQFFINDTAPTSTHFTVGASAASGGDFNTNGDTYVAYLFAHNDGDGEFGPDGDADIIKCGSYTGNGQQPAGPEIDLGFEPQWLLIKRADGYTDWRVVDVMRGAAVYPSNALSIRANTSGSENEAFGITLTPTGFIASDGSDQVNANGGTYIYMAIRRGPMAVPESATDVFAVDIADNSAPTNGYEYDSGFPVDMGLRGYRHYLGSSYYPALSSRLTQGKYLITSSTGAEQSLSSNAFDFMDGFYSGGQTDVVAWMWKRAPSFFDVVCYNGNSSVNTIDHNLGVAPEMMWIKARNSARNWFVYHTDVGITKYVELDNTQAEQSFSTWANSTAPTATQFTVNTSFGNLNSSSYDYIAFLFTTLDGISKVGSYTGTGSTQTINCGFSTSARFVLIKRTDSTGNWYVFDSERGITTGSDPYSAIDTTAGELTASAIQPHSSGFIVNSTSGSFNASGGTYLFYAIA